MLKFSRQGPRKIQTYDGSADNGGSTDDGITDRLEQAEGSERRPKGRAGRGNAACDARTETGWNPSA